jgi:hypothetical protein
MITNDGKQIISKYILGQVSNFATHLSIGCGAVPLNITDSVPANAIGKQMMDFEMTRVPISSKGFIDDSQLFVVTNVALSSNVATITTATAHNILIGESIIVSGVSGNGNSIFNGSYTVTSITTYTISYSLIALDVASNALSTNASVVVSRTKISFTAELPSSNKYEITEVGIWSAANNVLAGQYDSKMIFNFSQDWQYHTGNTIASPVLKTNTIAKTDGSGDIDISTNPQTTMFVPTTDTVFKFPQRLSRKEGPRNLDTTLLVRGDMSVIYPSSGIPSNGSGTVGTPWTLSNVVGTWLAQGTHIHLNNINFDISGNNPTDLLKLALSALDIVEQGSSSFNNIKILMEFYKNESQTSNSYAKAQIYIPSQTLSSTNRYFVSSWQISQNIDHSNYLSGNMKDSTLPYIQFYTSSDFSAPDIRVCKIWVMVDSAAMGSAPLATSNFFVAFDGFRIDNTLENPIYKMSGYSIVQTSGATTISKLANTNNYIDFRFSVGVS